MSKKVSKHFHKLRLLAEGNPRINKTLINEANSEFINCICECAKNVLNGNVPLTSKQAYKLEKHKHNLRTLINKRLRKDRKKNILQRGGFLPALLAPIAASLAGPLIKGLIS